MRITNPNILQQVIPPSPRERALRVLADQCTWIGEAFIGLGFILLSHARKTEDRGHSDLCQERVCLPSNDRGFGIAMREQEIVYECKGCRRLVKVILQIEGLPRCDDCVGIVSDKQNQFVNYGNN